MGKRVLQRGESEDLCLEGGRLGRELAEEMLLRSAWEEGGDGAGRGWKGKPRPGSSDPGTMNPSPYITSSEAVNVQSSEAITLCTPKFQNQIRIIFYYLETKILDFFQEHLCKSLQHVKLICATVTMVTAWALGLEILLLCSKRYKFALLFFPRKN